MERLMTAVLEPSTAPAVPGEPHESPIAGGMRLLTFPEIDFLCDGTTTTMAELQPAIKRVIDGVSAIRDRGRVVTIGGLILRYHGDEHGTFTLEAGFRIAHGYPEAVAAHVQRLPRFHCATLLVCGGMRHLAAAYDELGKQLALAGLKGTGACRECYLKFEGGASPTNVTRIALGLVG